MTDKPQKTTRSPSTIALLALIGGLVGLLQFVTSHGMPTGPGPAIAELIGSIGGGALLGALVGWIVQRVRGKRES